MKVEISYIKYARIFEEVEISEEELYILDNSERGAEELFVDLEQKFIFDRPELFKESERYEGSEYYEEESFRVGKNMY